jgi:hypothetical protein
VRDLIPAEPVLVDCPRGSREIRIRPAFRVDATSFAVIESVPWEHAGELVTSYTQRDGQVRKVWKAISDGGASVTADTREQVIAALLDVRGEFEVTIDQTIPPLFELEE